MRIIKYNHIIQFLFLIIWCFFLIRISSTIEFDSRKIINTFLDFISITIFIYFIFYLIVEIHKTKKIPKTSILIIYPVFGVIGYHFNDYKNLFQESILLHHFITLASVILFFSFLQSNKIFDYKFKELLLKVILIFFFIYSLLIIFPDIILKFNSYQNIRFSYKNYFTIFGNEFSLVQNINGQSKFLFVLEVIFFTLFKKYFFKNKVISHLFFFIGLLILILIYLMQSRLNILASFVFLFFLVLTFKNLDLIKKIIYLLIIVILPLSSFNFYTDLSSRFIKHKTHISDSFPSVVQYQSQVIANEKEMITKQIKILDIIENLSIKADENLSTKADENLSIKPRIKIKKISENLKLSILEITRNAEALDNQIKIDIHVNENIYIKWLTLISEIKSFQINLSQLHFDDADKEMAFLINEIKQIDDYYRGYIFSNCSKPFRWLDSALSGRVCGWELLLRTTTFKSLFIGKGFFADQVYLKIPVYKTASNSWFNIFYNTGTFSLIIFLSIILIFLIKFFKFKNFQHKNIYISISNYLIIYFFIRSVFEDTIAFVSFDFLLLGICMVFIKESFNLKNN
jgi:hypothetical protein